MVSGRVSEGKIKEKRANRKTKFDKEKIGK